MSLPNEIIYKIINLIDDEIKKNILNFTIFNIFNKKYDYFIANFIVLNNNKKYIKNYIKNYIDHDGKYISYMLIDLFKNDIDSFYYMFKLLINNKKNITELLHICITNKLYSHVKEIINNFDIIDFNSNFIVKDLLSIITELYDDTDQLKNILKKIDTDKILHNCLEYGYLDSLKIIHELNIINIENITNELYRSFYILFINNFYCNEKDVILEALFISLKISVNLYLTLLKNKRIEKTYENISRIINKLFNTINDNYLKDYIIWTVQTLTEK